MNLYNFFVSRKGGVGSFVRQGWRNTETPGRLRKAAGAPYSTF